MTLLCLASFEKGHAFLREAKRQGCRVLLLASLSLRDTAQWPPDGIDEVYYMPDIDKRWQVTDTLHAVSYLARTEQLDRVVPLDDFDLEMAAALREHLRLPGLGETATRFFRDKLAMRMRAAEAGVPVPAFTSLVHHGSVQRYLQQVPGPWMLKPRLLAGAIGIRKLHTADEVWAAVAELGDQSSYYLLERFIPGDIFHVDSIVADGALQFAIASRYGTPPMEVYHGGGIFTTHVLERGNGLERSLQTTNGAVLQAMGLRHGVSHTEFIQSHEDGTIYFLETSARVGGANIADLVESASGLNLWAEWAKLEAHGEGAGYRAAALREDYAGLLVSLARQEWPDLSCFAEPEVVWRMQKRHHVGLIVRSPDPARVTELLARYTERVRQEFHASAPALTNPGQEV